MRLNLRQVEAFRAVYLTGSMTAAGGMMFVTQPAVSRLIRDLEAALGLRLFDRKGAKLAATPDAVALFRTVERSYEGLDRIARAAEDIKRWRAGELRITASLAASVGCLPPVIARFRESHPGVVVTLDTASSPEIRDLLTLQRYDLGVAVVPAGTPGVATRDLPALSALCVVPLDHPLSRSASISPPALSGVPLIALAESSLMQMTVLRAFESAGVEPDIVIEATFSATICRLAAHGVGIGIVDPLTARLFDGRGVRALAFEPAVPYELKLLFPVHRPRNDHADTFAELLHDHLAGVAP